jgi:hypothetical protein
VQWAISPVEAERVQRFVKRLRKDDPLRGVADALLAGVHPPDDSAQIAFEALQRRSTTNAVKGVASWCLGLIPLSDADARQASTHLAAVLADRPGHSVGCLLAAGCIFFYILLLMAPIYAAMDTQKNRIREMAAISLGRLGRRDNIGDLIDAVTEMPNSTAVADKQVRFAAAYGLQLMLQNLPHGGFGALNEDGLRSVAQLLREPEDARHVPVLEILRTTGGPKALPPLEKFVRKATDPVLREMAGAAIEMITQRKELHAQRASLLRPSEEPQSDPTRLLRPTGTAASEPENLLRAELGGEDHGESG